MKNVIAAVLIVLLGIFWWYDETPAPPAFLVSPPQAAGEVDDYYLRVLGFDAPAVEDPLAFGRLRLQAYEAALAADPGPDDALAVDDHQPGAPYSLPEGPLFCRWFERDCAQVVAGETATGTVLREHAVLLQRYRQLVAQPPQGRRPAVFDDRRGPPGVPPGGWRAARLQTLQLLSRVRSGDAAGAIADHYAYITHLRAGLATSQDLLGKLTFARALIEAVDALALARREAPGLALAPLVPLALAERDLGPALAAEYRATQQDLAVLGRHPQAALDWGIAAHVFVPMLFRPGMTLERAGLRLAPAVIRSRLDNVAVHAASRNPAPPSPPGWIESRLNAIGLYRLDAVLSGDYMAYAMLMHDINAKLALFNALVAASFAVTDGMPVANPYYRDLREAYRDEAGHWICLGGPDADGDHVRCLPL